MLSVNILLSNAASKYVQGSPHMTTRDVLNSISDHLSRMFKRCSRIVRFNIDMDFVGNSAELNAVKKSIDGILIDQLSYKVEDFKNTECVYD